MKLILYYLCGYIFHSCLNAYQFKYQDIREFVV